MSNPHITAIENFQYSYTTPTYSTSGSSGHPIGYTVTYTNRKPQ